MKFETTSCLLELLSSAAQGNAVDADVVGRLHWDLPLWLQEPAERAWHALMHCASDADICERDPQYAAWQREAVQSHFDHLTALLEKDYR